MCHQAKIIMDDGTETTTGVGELCIKSPSLFKEYWRRPEVYFLFITDCMLYIFGKIPFHSISLYNFLHL
jgi:acyl-CoA synthetase (AMP-forming)/AMP-acid ligase II